MSSEWPVVAVEDVCSLIVDCVNKTAPVIDSKTPFRMIRTTNVRNGRIDLNECRYVDKETYEKWTRRAKLELSDVILTREAPIGEVGLVTEAEGVFLGQRLMQYRANPELLDSRFLLYSFLSPSLQYQFGSHEGSGSVVSHIRVGDCFKFKLTLPPLEVQKSISSLLGAIDDRITLLRETNTTLEAIAQALFKSWFVDFNPVHAKQQGRAPDGMDAQTAALFPDSFEESELGMVPKGWKITTIDGLASIKGGKQLEKENFKSDGRYPIFGGAGVMGYSDLFNAEGFLIVVGRVGAYCGQFFWLNGKGWINNNASLISVKEKNNSIFLLHCLKSFDMNLIKKGAAQPFISNGDISALNLVMPPERLINKFNEIANPIFDNLGASVSKLNTLTSIRDTLLPRLISGQLRLPEAQALVEDAVDA